jgi:hypothetical protein
MSVKISKFDSMGMKATVTVEGDTFDDVSSMTAKAMVLAEAQRHLGKCGISSQTGAYPIDPDGNEITDAAKYDEAVSKHVARFRYRNEYSVQQSIAF